MALFIIKAIIKIFQFLVYGFLYYLIDIKSAFIQAMPWNQTCDKQLP